jgi:hypothetical protein
MRIVYEQLDQLGDFLEIILNDDEMDELKRNDGISEDFSSNEAVIRKNSLNVFIHTDKYFDDLGE